MGALDSLHKLAFAIQMQSVKKREMYRGKHHRAVGVIPII